MARRIALPLAALLLGIGAIAAGLGVFSSTPELSIDDSSAAPGSTPTAAPAAPPSSTPTRTTASVEELAEIAREAAASYPKGITPIGVEIPAIGVDAPLVDLGRKSETEIEVPATAGDAGWYTPSRRPGEIGPSIIAGHVDLNGGPAVFHRLRELEPGDEIIVHGDQGEQLTFVVDRLGQYGKYELPDDVFGFGQAQPEVRLITCGGVFNRATGHYEDNIVVYTHQKDWQ